VYQRTYHLVLLAEALSACGGYGGGLSAVEEGEVLVEQTGERCFEAEISRLRGHLLLARAANGSAAAEDRSVAGSALARTARGTILARPWRDQGKRNEARELLAPIYGWFTQGFDTLDLKQATLLDEAHP
jgi:predicted ATPase